jgi:site-specific DNA-methyltransferase (adenine-specific)
MNQIILGDCLEVMRGFEDNQFDLVLTDPPYGIYSNKKATGFSKKRVDWGLGDWDKRVTREYFDEMFRVSKNQVIFGANYYLDFLPPTKEMWVWDKKTGKNFFADGELMWTSYTGTTRIFLHQWCGAFKDSERGIKAQHPTQKPIAVMKWCLRKTKEGDQILDPFVGSGSTLIACKNLNRNYIGIEINPDYVKIAEDRLKQEVLL